VLTLTFPKGVPSKLGVRFPTDTNNYHMSECTVIPPTGLLVSLSRAGANTLVVTIDNNHAFTDAGGVTTLPGGQAIEIDDLHNCDTSTPGTIFKTEAPVPLLWKVDFPAGASCPARILGSYQASVQADGTPAPFEETPAVEPAL
jgi:hypothetical protein